MEGRKFREMGCKTQNGRTMEFLNRKRIQERKAKREISRNKRSMAVDGNRNLPEEPKKELSYAEKYRIWKEEKDQKRKLEAENRKKQRPIFKIGGSVKDVKSLPLVSFKRPAKAPNTKKNINNAQTSTRNIEKQKSSSNNRMKTTEESEVNTNGPSELVVAIQGLSVTPEILSENPNSTFTLSDSETVIQGSNELDETIHDQITVINERNEIIYITPSTRVTRSKKRQDQNQDGKVVENKQVVKKSPNLSKKTPVKKVTNFENPHKTPDAKLKKNPQEKTPKVLTERNMPVNIENFKTPEKDDIPQFVSEFVTTSRGKNSVKKERLSRRSLLSYVEDDSPQHRKIQAEYYRNVLNNAIIRLMSVHDDWVQYKEENLESLSEDSIDLINTALGQTLLLIKSKFEQFRGLIDQSESDDKDVSQKVRAIDLTAFWDMVFIQVENIDMRYNKLAMLRDNNWKEFEDCVKKQKSKRIVRRLPSKTSKGSSLMKDVIKAGRKRQVNNSNKNGANCFVRISTPKTKCHFLSKDENDTPTKSILKTPGLNKSLSGKAVFFRNSDCNEIVDFDETLPAEHVRSANDPKTRQSINLISWTPPDADTTITRSNTPRNTRQSIQLNRGILS